MGSTDFGGQACTVGYAAPAISTSWNTRNLDLVPVGIYKGGYLAKTTGNSFSVDTLVCEIRDENYQVRIATTSPVTLTFVTDSAPYVVLRWAYSASATNFMDMLLVAAADIHENDLVLGKCVSTVGPVLSTFDYGDVAHPKSTPNNPVVALRVEAEQTPTALRVWVRAGRVLNNAATALNQIYDTNLTFDAAVGTNRVDLVVADDTGAHVYKGNSTSAPSYALAHSTSAVTVLAEVTVRAGATVVYQSDIKDVRLYVPV